MFGGITIAWGHRRRASLIGIALRHPNFRASYDAADTTLRPVGAPIKTGLPTSDGSSRCSTEA
jgi:hypothetical protein